MIHSTPLSLRIQGRSDSRSTNPELVERVDVEKAVLYKTLENRQVMCTACSWYCRIAPGATGVCAVRQNINGQLYLLVYGQAASVNIDPIEKKPLYHFFPGSKILSFGTVGCNFGCEFCQNFDISQASKELKIALSKDGKPYLFGKSLSHFGINISPEELVNYALSNELDQIAYTYNEPSIFIEYAYDTARLARRSGLRNVFVSNGFESPESLDYIGPYLDAINIDLKSFREDFYRKVCFAKMIPVLQTIRKCWKLGIWVEITTLLIPKENDSVEELSKIAHFIASVSTDIPWHVTRFHPDYKMVSAPATSPEVLEKAYRVGKSAGLKYVYVGNAAGSGHEDTRCPTCGELLVERHGYEVQMIGLIRDKCTKCHTKIAGRWP